MNKEIFVMMIFFAGIVTFLGLVLGSGITVNNPNNVVLNSGNSSVVNPQFNQQSASTCTNLTSIPIGSSATGGTQSSILNFFNTVQQGFDSIATTFYNGFSTIDNLVTNGVYNGGGLVVAPSSTTVTNNGNCALNQQAQANLAAFQATGFVSKTVTGATAITDLVASTIIIGGIFVGLGLLAGVLGAGSFANIIAASGIGLSLIFFMQQILGSVYFAGTPFILQIFLTGITGMFFIWIVLTLLRN